MLYLVVIYKVKWEHKDLNTYLYLYDCGNELCSSTTRMSDYYSKVLCEDDICPYVERIVGNTLILKREDKSWLYDYINAKVINDDYINYKYINNNQYVVSNTDNLYGVINGDGEVIVPLKYNHIIDYKNNIISYKSDNKCGIIRIDNGEIEAKYDDIILINDKIFAGKMNNIYQLYSYDAPDIESSNKYNYVFAYDDIILVANNNKIDFLNHSLKSTLLMKIETFYDYTTEKERDSLKIRIDNDNIYFRVFLNESEYVEKIYNIKNKKIVS
jgi:hypothetical protein